MIKKLLDDSLSMANFRRAKNLVPVYVGDIDVNVTESEIVRLFNTVGDVASAKICRDHWTDKSLGYGFVNYFDVATASKAIKELNFTPLKGKQIRVSMSDLSGSHRVKGGNVFVKYLDESIDSKKLHDIFSVYGDIISCKVETRESGESRCFGFVQYTKVESAKDAIGKLNGSKVHGKEIYVATCISRSNNDADENTFTNVFVKNFTETTSEDDLRNAFEKFGKIGSLAVMRYEDGTSKCFGFAQFEDPERAAESVEALNGRVFNGRKWYVGRAQTKCERRRELKLRHERVFGPNNLYVRNLGCDIDEDELERLFVPFGRIVSCKVVCDKNGIKKGVGYVAFSTFQEAAKAISEMNGKMVGEKHLYVAVLERKQDRFKRLQALFQNMQQDAMLFPGITTAYHRYGPQIPLHPPMPIISNYQQQFLLPQIQQRYVFGNQMRLGSINHHKVTRRL